MSHFPKCGLCGMPATSLARTTCAQSDCRLKQQTFHIPHAEWVLTEQIELLKAEAGRVVCAVQDYLAAVDEEDAGQREASEVALFREIMEREAESYATKYSIAPRTLPTLVGLSDG